MDDLTATALYSMIHKQFETWVQDDTVKEIREAILQGCAEEDRVENIYAKMIFNSMEIAAFISAKIIFKMLFDQGVLKPVEAEKLRRNMFSVMEDKPTASGVEDE